jgi:hypothetical protein
MSSFRRLLLSLIVVLVLSGAVLAFFTFQNRYVGFDPLDLTEGHDYLWVNSPAQLDTVAQLPWATSLSGRELPALSVWGEPSSLPGFEFTKKLLTTLAGDNGVVWVEGGVPEFIIPFASYADAQASLDAVAKVYNLAPDTTLSIDPWTLGIAQSALILAPTKEDIETLKNRTHAIHGLPHDGRLRLKAAGIAASLIDTADDKLSFELEGLPFVPAAKSNPASHLSQLESLNPAVSFYSSDFNAWLKAAASRFPALAKSFSSLHLDADQGFRVYLKKNFAFVLLPVTRSSAVLPGMAVVSEVSGGSRIGLENALNAWEKELTDQVSHFPAITTVTLPDGTRSRELADLSTEHFAFDTVAHQDFTVTKLRVPLTTSESLPALGLAWTVWKNYFILANDEQAVEKVVAVLAAPSLPGRGPTPHLLRVNGLKSSYELLAPYFELAGSPLPESFLTSQIQNMELSFFGGKTILGSATLGK